MKKSSNQVSHSIRLDRGLYEELAKEASDEAISFNNLIIRILKKHTEFDRYTRDLQFLLIHKSLVRRSMQAQKEDVILSTGEEAGGAFARDALLAMGMPLNRNSVLYFVDTILCKYKNFADCQRTQQEGKEMFYLRHELGMKWSLFLKGYVSGAFKNILDEEVKIEATRDGIIFTA